MTNSTWVATIADTAGLKTTVQTTFPENLRLLKQCFRGVAAPNLPLAGQIWEDTTVGVLKQYTGSSWVVLGPRAMHAPLVSHLMLGTISATTTRTLWVPQAAAVIESLVLYHRTATTSNGSDNWTVNLTRDDTDASLFSSVPTTNGSDLAAKTAKVYTPNQNATLATGVGLALTLTKTGSATNLVDLLVQVRGYEANP